MVQPSRGLIDGPNSGTLMLMLLPGLPVGGAALTGTGLAADGVHILSFGWNLTPPLEGYAWLFPKAGTPPGGDDRRDSKCDFDDRLQLIDRQRLLGRRSQIQTVAKG
jgi:hypothetical protein